MCMCVYRRANIVCYSTIVCWMFQGRSMLLLRQLLPEEEEEKNESNWHVYVTLSSSHSM